MNPPDEFGPTEARTRAECIVEGRLSADRLWQHAIFRGLLKLAKGSRRLSGVADRRSSEERRIYPSTMGSPTRRMIADRRANRGDRRKA